MRAEARHQLKQDAFSRVTMEAAGRTATWTAEHQTTVIIAAIVITVVAASVVGGWYYLSTQNDKASVEMSQAVRTLQTPLRPAGAPAQPEYPSFASLQERSQAAAKQFQAIVSHYPHTRTAELARYFLGVTAMDSGDTAGAERDFKGVISDGNRELASMAKLALASLYADNNRSKDAVRLYQELINKPTTSVSKATAELQLAELYKSTNQPADAKRVYEQIKKDDPQSEASQLAEQKLAELK